MRLKRIQEWAQLHKKHICAAGAGAVLMLLVGLLGINGKTKTVPETTTVIVETSVAAMTEPIVPEIPVLELDQIKLLDGLVSYLKEDNLSEAASHLQRNEQKLQYLFYQTLEGKWYCYKDGALSEELKGTGLVMKKPGAVFYGNLQDGMPQGEGIALQVIQLDSWRYDYSEGTWEMGRMEGAGAVGYHYDQGTDGEENQSVRKEGNFTMDLMEGDFSYATTNSEGETTTWDMKAEGGKTVTDDRWTYEEEKQGYYLPSNQDSSHAYVLPESSVEEVRWRNMLAWEE